MTAETNQPATSESDGLGWILNVPPMGFEPTLPA